MKKYLAGAIMLVLAIGMVSESFAQRKTGRSKNADVWMGSYYKERRHQKNEPVFGVKR